MLHQILSLTWKDLKIFLKDPGAVVLLFVQPFMFIVVMSYALSGLFRSGEEQPFRILAANEDEGIHAAAILQQVDALEAFEVETIWEGQPLTRPLLNASSLAGNTLSRWCSPPISPLCWSNRPPPKRRAPPACW